MKTVSLLAAFTFFIANANGAPPLEIQSAVEIKFGTSNNRIYQLEVASPESLDVWRPVGPAKWGRGKIVTNVVPIAIGSQVVFRSREYDLTNGLAYYFPIDGVYAIGLPPIVNVPNYTTSRFGTPNHAALQGSWDYEPATFTTVRQFAVGTNDFSISIWSSSEENSDKIFGRIFSAELDNPGFGLTNTYQLELMATNNGSIELYFGGSTIPILVTRPLTWESGRWYCFQLVRKANVFRVYRDVELVGEVFSEVANNQSSLTIFMGPENGMVDEVRFYKRALSDEELGVLFRLEED
jgi:hypothetical protein